ncbi:MAG TPA: hypothetical protein VLH56_16925 [Dissulfurispiraceae bacterium]|nr:hypothetical protein [Dissulfurispiraceae bacterium]
MSKQQEKVIAKELYVNSRLSQKEIAQRVGVREATMSRWVVEGGWETLRTAGSITRKALLQKAYQNLQHINQHIETECGGLPNKKTLDAKNAIIREIQTLDKGDSLALTVAIMEDFHTFVTRVKPSLAKELVNLQLEFLETKVGHETTNH